MFDKDKVEKSYYHYRYVCCIGSRAVLKIEANKIVNELKIKRQTDSVLKFLNGTNTNAVMESGNQNTTTNIHTIF
jgi:hypothetical protein